MTFTFKLSRRLSAAHGWSVAALIFGVGCSTEDITNAHPDTPESPSTPAAMVLEVDQRLPLAQLAYDKTGGPLHWESSGGRIDKEGAFSASEPGTFKVVGRGRREKKADTTTVIVVPRDTALVDLVVSPSGATIEPQGNQIFNAKGIRADGTTVPVGVQWATTGGTIDPAGYFVAGSKAGRFAVSATNPSTGLADTVSIEIVGPIPTLISVELTPATVTLSPAATQHFAAVGHLGDGSSAVVTVTYSAAGGTITRDGLFTAGTTPGSYLVIARTDDDVGDTSTVTIPSQDPAMTISPGASIQAAVNAYPAGTRFLIKAGVHKLQSVIPKDGNTFRCEPGAVLDGRDSTAYAFKRSGASPRDVRIVGCEVTRYVPAKQMGAILAGGHNVATETTTGWVCDSCNIHHNANGGIRLGHRMKVRWSKVTHNGTIGLVGAGDSIEIRDNEIAYNNTSGVDPGFEAGGTKFVLTRWLTVAGNYVHHNKGPGLWTDIDNIYTLYEQNRVEDNTHQGIFHEISYDAVIRNNTLRGNGYGRTGYGGSPAIMVSASPNVEVYGNDITGKVNGIIAIQQSRGSGRYGPHEISNLYVHHNTVTLPTGGYSGLLQDVTDNSYFTSRNNRWQANTYNLPPTSRSFSWLGAFRTDAEWGGYGHDTQGVFNR